MWPSLPKEMYPHPQTPTLLDLGRFSYHIIPLFRLSPYSPTSCCYTYFIFFILPLEWTLPGQRNSLFHHYSVRADLIAKYIAALSRSSGNQWIPPCSTLGQFSLSSKSFLRNIFKYLDLDRKELWSQMHNCPVCVVQLAARYVTAGDLLRVPHITLTWWGPLFCFTE